MTRLFRAEVPRKLQRLMPHVDRHLISLSCLRQGYSEENEMAPRQFKDVYSFPYKLSESLGQTLITAWHYSSSSSTHLLEDVDIDLSNIQMEAISPSTLSDTAYAISLCNSKSGKHTHAAVSEAVLFVRHDGRRQIWKLI